MVLESLVPRRGNIAWRHPFLGRNYGALDYNEMFEEGTHTHLKISTLISHLLFSNSNSVSLFLQGT